MLALAFRAGPAHLAIAARSIVEVLPRVQLHPSTMAPPAVRGLLPFRGTLTPVVDLCLLVAGVPAAAVLGTRIVVVEVRGAASVRYVGLLAESVSELVDMGASTPGLHLAEQPWLGEHLVHVAGMPQLVEPADLLPDALSALFVLKSTPPDAQHDNAPGPSVSAHDG